MKEDRIYTIVGVLCVLCGLMAMSVGHFIMGGIIMLLAFGIFWSRGGGKFNDRSIFENIVKTDLSVEELYERIKDIDTPLGRAWIAEHKGFAGKSIVFGPSRFKDCVVISRRRNYLDIKHITLLANIIRSSEDEYRFENLINPDGLEVTPKRYAVFASMKLASVMLLRHLTELTEKLSSDRDAVVPDSLDIFDFYYHNSSEGWFRDADDNDVLKVEEGYNPFVARVLNADDEEMASVKPRLYDKKGHVKDPAGFDMYANGEHYADIRRRKKGGRDCFEVDTEDGKFFIESFPACHRANISSNYTISKDDRLVAVIGGSPKLVFDTVGKCRNDLVLSYDDDYLVLYAVMQVFIMTLNRSFLK